MSDTPSPSSHPHFERPLPPPSWRDGSQPGPVPRLIPSLIPTGERQHVAMNFADTAILEALEHFFPEGSDFPVASARLDGAPSHYDHLFIRDAAYGLMMLQGTQWPARIRRPNVVRNFLAQAYRYQGERDVPNAKVPWANDGEKPGRLPHEFWMEWEQSANARYLHNDLGWQWPTYFGAVDTTPIVAMMTAKEAKLDPTFLLDPIWQVSNRGATRQSTVLQAYVGAVQHLLEECRITEQNPEGIYETAPMSNFCWGDWDDSYDIIRTKNGEVPTTRVAHAQLQAFARSAMLGLIEVVEGVQTQFQDGTLSADDFLAINEALHRAGLEFGSPVLEEAKATAERLGDALSRYFVIEGDPEYGTYFALGTYRDTETNELRPLDVCSAKPALMLLVEPQHLPQELTAIALEQVFDPDKGILLPNGAANLSRRDPFFGDNVYHHTNWPDKNGLYEVGAETQGAEGLANEMGERNWHNFIDPFVRGYFEFVRADGYERPTPVQEDVQMLVRGSNPEWRYNFIKHAMGSNGEAQFWSLCAAAHAQDRLSRAWAGELPHRATNPALAEVEAGLMARIEASEGLRTEALYHREEPEFFERFTSTVDRETPHGRVETVIYDGGAVEAVGQRMPGEATLGRGLSGPSL